MKIIGNYKKIDMAAYPRKEHYKHFLDMKCAYSVTVNIDVTKLCAKLKKRDLRPMPTLTWLVSNAANAVEEFRMDRLEGELIVWDVRHPSYVVLCDKTKTFSGLWTEYNADFKAFYKACTDDIKKYVDGSLEPKGAPPINQVYFSSVPFLPFTSLNFNVAEQWFAPILTAGKFIQQDGKTLMPLAIQVHHAACDGYHIGQFIDRLQALADNTEEWL